MSPIASALLPRRARATALAALVALACAPAGTVLASGAASGTALNRASNAAPATADLRLPDLDGRTQALSQWRGKPVLVNYWATWCGPCIKEMPELDAFSQAQRGAGAVQVVGVALDEVPSVKAYLARKPVRYPVLVEAVDYGDSGSSARYGNTHGVLPYSVLLDAQGRVVRSKAGPLTHAELTEWQRALRN